MLPYAKIAIKKEMGIGTSEKAVSSKPFGRAVYAIRDLWQGVWWTIPALVLSVGLITILLAILKKVFGV